LVPFSSSALQLAHALCAEDVCQLEVKNVQGCALALGDDPTALGIVGTMVAVQGQAALDDHDGKGAAVEWFEAGRPLLGALEDTPPLAVEKDAGPADDGRIDRASRGEIDVLLILGEKPLRGVVLLRRLHVFAHERRFGQDAIAMRDVDEDSGATTMRAATGRVGIAVEARGKNFLAHLKVGEIGKLMLSKRKRAPPPGRGSFSELVVAHTPDV
jgi:hypothetical protein